MRKLIAAMRLSLDGRSQGPDGYADWVDAWSEDYGLMERIDACLLGGHMYPGYEQYWTAIRQEPAQPLPMTGRLPHPDELRWSEFTQRTPHYVLSTTLQTVSWPQTRLLRHADAVRELKTQPGKSIYLMGGASLIGSMLDIGLVDELHCIVYPLLLGPAQGPFEKLAHRQALKLLDQRLMDEGLMHLTYRVG
ncbi:dihydrofolate reductase family protein [Hylemonella sp. W303a]|uniref:dihydrofolate reductase family protein n=1 Tax=Hylemonella sp. W303a TaxID=3389873 RepID=UPI00396B22BE